MLQINKNAVIACAVLAVSLWSTATIAEDKPGLLGGIPGEFSANVGLTSQYLFRGLDQSDEMPALQGGIDYSVDTGLKGISVYLGTWASNVNFNDGNSAELELDGYGGVKADVGGVGLEAGFIYYGYPGAAASRNYNFVEYKLGASYEPITNLGVGVNYFYSPDFFGGSGKSHFIQGTASYTLPYFKTFDVSLNGTLGKQYIQKNSVFLQPDYVTWTAGVGVQLTKNLTASVTYVDTDIKKTACGGTGTDACDARAIFALTASF